MLTDGLWKRGRALRNSEAVRGTQGFSLEPKGPQRRSLIQEGPNMDPVSMKPTAQGPLTCLPVYACMTVAVAVAVCTLVCTCVLSPGVPVFMSVCGVSVYPQAYGWVHTLLR